MIVRAIAMKDASATGTSCACAGSTDVPGFPVADLGGRACDVTLYAGLQVLSSTAGGVKVFLQNNSSSEGDLNAWVDMVAFTSQSCRNSCMQTVGWNPTSGTSTDRTFWRAAMTQTCAQTNNWLAAMSLE